uniref:DNA-directed RNA polymerase n=1 Tax=viral metagenome TaxID=1070528 RepID=A0A6C0J6I4_9ZZZZ
MNVATDSYDWNKNTWSLIDSYFQDKSQLVKEQINSYNDFINNWLPTFLQQNRIVVSNNSRELKFEIINCSICKPARYVNRQGKRPLTPADARNNDYNYMARLYVDFRITDTDNNRDTKVEEFIETKVCIGGIPAMVRSSVCHLNGRSPGEASTLGECPFDLGGYFIIHGGERAIIAQERPKENDIFVFSEANASSSKDLIRAEIKSTIDQRYFPVRLCSIRLSKELTLRVYVPYNRRPIPIGIIFKAFGAITDKEIQECLIDIDDKSNEDFVNIVANSIRESSMVLTQEDAIMAVANSINININPEDFSSTDVSDEIKTNFRKKYAKDMLNRDFLAHVGNSPVKKLRFMSRMVRELLNAYRDPRLLTDRDSLLSKRLDLSGPLLSQIFRTQFLQLIRDIKHQFGRIMTNCTQEQIIGISRAHEIRRIIQKNSVEKKLTHALSTGNWQTSRNSNNSNSKKGVAQVLQRLSYPGYLSHLCRINSPLDSNGSKNVLPRKLHGTQIPKICPAETPEGAQVGIVKNKAMLLTVTIETSSAPAMYCIKKLGLIDIMTTSPTQIHRMTQVIINGDLVGLISSARETQRILKTMRYFKLTGTINKTVSISWQSDFNTLKILTDGGRYTVPYYRIDEDNHFVVDNWIKANRNLGTELDMDFNKLTSCMPTDLLDSLDEDDVAPFNAIKDKGEFNLKMIRQAPIEYLDTDEDSTSIIADTPEKLYNAQTFRIGANNDYYGHLTQSVKSLTNKTDKGPNTDILDEIYKHVNKSIRDILESLIIEVDVIDPKTRYIILKLNKELSEGSQQVAIININRHISGNFTRYTHCLLHPAQIHGVIGMNIPFSDHNPSPRNCYQSSMGKQALGIFASNYDLRWDTMANIMTYPQRPVTQTRTAKYVGLDKLFHGYNNMHCISTYSGYNQEDSLVGSLDSAKRGAHNSLYYRTYTAQLRRISDDGDGAETFQIPPTDGTIGRRQGNDGSDRYHAIVPSSKKNGKTMAPELPLLGSILVSGDVIIPKTKNIHRNDVVLHSDNSVTVRASEGGMVDAIIPSEEYPNDENEDGYKIIKIRLVQLRQPVLGDKFASMSAQKGTLGIQFNSADLIKSTSSGKPDTIMNPHAVPSRMTLGQLFSAHCSLYGLLTGRFMDSTPFTEFNINDISAKLRKLGYDDGGEQLMYNGFTGDVIGIAFYGPTYYQRLKHMVQDKMHARDTGPIQSLTRQPAEGRARGGGLRIGEMERDALIAYGLTSFLREKFCEASDIFEFYVSPEKQTVISANPKHGIYKYGMDKAYSDGVKRVIMPYATDLFRKELMQSMVKMIYTFQ